MSTKTYLFTVASVGLMFVSTVATAETEHSTTKDTHITNYGSPAAGLWGSGVPSARTVSKAFNQKGKARIGAGDPSSGGQPHADRNNMGSMGADYPTLGRDMAITPESGAAPSQPQGADPKAHDSKEH